MYVHCIIGIPEDSVEAERSDPPSIIIGLPLDAICYSIKNNTLCLFFDCSRALIALVGSDMSDTWSRVFVDCECM